MKKEKKKGYPLIRQRTLRDPISITNFLGDSKIKLEIKTSPEDWEMLYSIFQYSNQIFNNYLRESFIQFIPEFRFFKSRGYMNTLIGRIIYDLPDRKAKREHISRNIKTMAAILYMFFSYCFKIYKNELPPYIKKIKDEANDNEKTSLKIKNDKPDPLGYTIHCMKNCYDDELLKSYKLDPYNDRDNFKITYIQAGKDKIRKDHDYAVLVWQNIFSISKREISSFIRNVQNAFLCSSYSIKNLNDDANQFVKYYLIYFHGSQNWIIFLFVYFLDSIPK